MIQIEWRHSVSRTTRYGMPPNSGQRLRTGISACHHRQLPTASMSGLPQPRATHFAYYRSSRGSIGRPPTWIARPTWTGQHGQQNRLLQSSLLLRAGLRRNSRSWWPSHAEPSDRRSYSACPDCREAHPNRLNCSETQKCLSGPGWKQASPSDLQEPAKIPERLVDGWVAGDE